MELWIILDIVVGLATIATILCVSCKTRKATKAELDKIKAEVGEKCGKPITVKCTCGAELEQVEKVEEKPNVAFSTTAKDTLEEKYAGLSAEQKAFYDEISAYALAKEDAKQFKNLRYEEIKIGKARLVRMLIKRSQVVCEFIMYNSDFKNYVNENKVAVKQAATVIKINNAASVQAAKDSIDIVVNTINEEKEYKKQLAKERRKAARLAKANKA